MTHRLLKLAICSMLALTGGVFLASGVSAQDDTTSTTQLDIGGGDGEGDGTTTTTQLDVGGAEGTTTTTQLDTGAEAPPNRVDAGAGGTDSNAATPLALIALAGGLVVVTATAARRVRATQH